MTSTLFGAAGTTCTTAAGVGGIPIVGAGLLPALVEACNAANVVALASVPACAELVAIGDTRGPLQAGVDYATAHGVPIIASMGNNIGSSLPDVVTAFVDITDDGDAMKIIRATLPGVIAVGAAQSIGSPGSPAPWKNTQVRGASVAV